MKSIISIILFLCPFLMMGQDLVQKANTAYEKDKYKDALELYLQAEKAKGSSSDLYYNIGNSYYRMGNMGRAILYYERALLLDPSNSDARTNLEFVNDKIQIKSDTGDSFISEWIDSAVSTHSSNSWATLAAVFFLALLGAALLYVFARKVALRKIGFFGGWILIAVMAFSIVCAFHMRDKMAVRDKAIVIVPSSTLSTSPRAPKDKSEEAFLLTEGNKVAIVDSVENKTGMTAEKWYDVKAGDSHRAWIRSSDIEKI